MALKYKKEVAGTKAAISAASCRLCSLSRDVEGSVIPELKRVEAVRPSGSKGMRFIQRARELKRGNSFPFDIRISLNVDASSAIDRMPRERDTRVGSHPWTIAIFDDPGNYASSGTALRCTTGGLH